MDLTLSVRARAVASCSVATLVDVQEQFSVDAWLALVSVAAIRKAAPFGGDHQNNPRRSYSPTLPGSAHQGARGERILDLLVRVSGIVFLRQSQTDDRGGSKTLFLVKLQFGSECLETQS